MTMDRIVRKIEGLKSRLKKPEDPLVTPFPFTSPAATTPEPPRPRAWTGYCVTPRIPPLFDPREACSRAYDASQAGTVANGPADTPPAPPRNVDRHEPESSPSGPPHGSKHQSPGIGNQLNGFECQSRGVEYHSPGVEQQLPGGERKSCRVAHKSISSEPQSISSEPQSTSHERQSTSCDRQSTSYEHQAPASGSSAPTFGYRPRGDTNGRPVRRTSVPGSPGSAASHRTRTHNLRRGSDASGSSGPRLPPGSYYDYDPTTGRSFVPVQTVSRRIYWLEIDEAGRILRICTGDVNGDNRWGVCQPVVVEDVELVRVVSRGGTLTYRAEVRVERPLCVFCMKEVPPEHYRGSSWHRLYRDS